MSASVSGREHTGRSAAAIKSALRTRALDACTHLFPAGRRCGNEFDVGSLKGEPGRSLRINLTDKIGVWQDFATTEKGSNLLDLWSRARCNGDFPRALREAAEWLGLERTGRPRWHVVVPVPADASAAPQGHPTRGLPARVWAYHDAAGALLGYRYRFDRPGGKDILPLTYCEAPDGSRGWCWQDWARPRPLYGLDRLAARPDAPVLVVEGEKTADAAQALFPDFVAITSPGGSHAAHRADWSPLRGRDVTVWPDHD